MLDDIDTKSSSLVSEALLDTYSDEDDINIKNLPVFESYSDFMNALVTEDNVEAVAKQLSRAASSSSLDSTSLG